MEVVPSDAVCDAADHLVTELLQLVWRVCWIDRGWGRILRETFFCILRLCFRIRFCGCCCSSPWSNPWSESSPKLVARPANKLYKICSVFIVYTSKWQFKSYLPPIYIVTSLEQQIIGRTKHQLNLQTHRRGHRWRGPTKSGLHLFAGHGPCVKLHFLSWRAVFLVYIIFCSIFEQRNA